MSPLVIWDHDTQEWIGGGSTPPVGTAPSIVTTAFGDIIVGVPFDVEIVYTGNEATFADVFAGDLPDGVAFTLASGTARVHGTPTTAGDYSCTLRLSNSFGEGTRAFNGTVTTTDFELAKAWFQANTGCRIPYGQLTPHTGSNTLSTPGATYVGVFFQDTVRPNAPGITFIDCWFEAGYYGLLNNDNAAPGLTVEHSTFECGSWTNSVLIMSEGAEVRYCDIFGGQDGMKLGADVLVEYTYIHDLDDSDPLAHNDGIQVIDGANGLTIRFCWIECHNTGCISIFVNDGTYANITLHGNYFGGGAGYLIYAGGSSTTNFTVTDNAFGDRGYGVITQYPTAGTNTWSGNYDYATGNPINP